MNKCCEKCRNIDGNNDGEYLGCLDPDCPCHREPLEEDEPKKPKYKPCDCPKGGIYEDGIICDKCGGSEWIVVEEPQVSKECKHERSKCPEHWICADCGEDFSFKGLTYAKEDPKVSKSKEDILEEFDKKYANEWQPGHKHTEKCEWVCSLRGEIKDFLSQALDSHLSNKLEEIREGVERIEWYHKQDKSDSEINEVLAKVKSLLK